MLNAVDISNWSGLITRKQVRDWKAAGVKLVICGTQRDLIAQQQLNMAAAEGLALEAYTYLYWAGDTAYRVRHALDVIRGHPVRRLWIDCEDAVSVFGEAEFRIAFLEAQIQNALDSCGDMPHGIYTGRWWWEPNMAGSRCFVNERVWYSHYDMQPNFNDWYNGFAFGGWEHPAGKQYAGSVQLCGVNVDLNYFAEIVENGGDMNALEELLDRLEAAEAEPEGSYAKVLLLARACVLAEAGQVRTEIQNKLVQAAVYFGAAR